MPLFTCPSRRAAASDRNFDNNDNAPLVMHAASLGDYAANAGYAYDTGMGTAPDIEGNPEVQFGVYTSAKAGPIFSGSRISDRNISDGLSNTLAIGERYIPPVAEGTQPGMEDYSQGDTAFISGDQPRTIFAGTEAGFPMGPKDPSLGKFGSSHMQVHHFVFLDGHVNAVADTISLKELMALSTIAGGETVTQPD
jgi:hypothetical protein